MSIIICLIIKNQNLHSFEYQLVFDDKESCFCLNTSLATWTTNWKFYTQNLVLQLEEIHWESKIWYSKSFRKHELQNWFTDYYNVLV